MVRGRQTFVLCESVCKDAEGMGNCASGDGRVSNYSHELFDRGSSITIAISFGLGIEHQQMLVC